MSIIIEGTLGAGKTTTLLQLEESWADLYECVREPVEEWTESTNRLAELYQNPRENAFSFEVDCLLKLSQSPDPASDKLTIQERSMYATYYVFSTYYYESGHISESDFETLTNLFERCIKKSYASGIFYLKLDPDTAFERIRSRGRPAESIITKDFLRRVCTLYDQLLIDKAHLFNIPVKVVEATANPRILATQLHEFIQGVDLEKTQSHPLRLHHSTSNIITWNETW